ncbi:MAG: thrombospondin type 3 repeat-containing protein, partial [Mariprofundaceae bacterium]
MMNTESIIKKSLQGLAFVALLAFSASPAYAFSSFLNSFNATYPSTTLGGDCLVCHMNNSGGGFTAYGSAYKNNGKSFTAIEALDSDGDGITNLDEINANTNPSSSSTGATTPASSGDDNGFEGGDDNDNGFEGGDDDDDGFGEDDAFFSGSGGGCLVGIGEAA